MTRPLSYFHLHLISDATGETLLAAGRAASAQYANARAIEHIYPLIRTEKQLRKVLEDIDAEPGIVLYTIVDRSRNCNSCRAKLDSGGWPPETASLLIQIASAPRQISAQNKVLYKRVKV